MLVPSLVVGILLAVISMLPNLSVFHPNRQLAHQEAERISASTDGAKLVEKLERFSDRRPLGLTSLAFSYLNAAIRGELISRLFLLSVIALMLTKITGARPARLAIESFFLRCSALRRLVQLRLSHGKAQQLR